ncbi:unnamed protein product [Adineta ricciae]|uniref:PDZ domain-containing protein n=1 Tax=Adineta ricciae TaxID=249248 RepID=A0A815XIS3_ADIRI|nr:unnamed protein product [Adineta ricciae]CAF1557891.1 unnamed protein product [Adineta ricciae]
MSENIQAANCEGHWEEKEFLLERSSVDDNTPLGFAIAGGNDLPIVKNFIYIIVVRIIKNGLADIDKQLKLYDIILRVNETDYSNIKHRTAIETLKMSGKQVSLRIRRLKSQFMQTIELEHQNGKLGIAIEGGIGNEYFKGDHGVFVTHIYNQISKELNIGDRLIEISSKKNTYDLRFVTHNEARQRIGLACSDSQKVNLTVSNRARASTRLTRKSNILHPGQNNLRGTKDEIGRKDNPVISGQVQYDERNYRNQGTSLSSNESNYKMISDSKIVPLRKDINEQIRIQSFDFEDYQRYESYNKSHAIGYPTERAVLSPTPLTADLQIHLAVAQKTGVLQFDQKNLKEIPPEICLMSGLRTLSLNSNDIRLLPDNLRNLISLKNLFLKYNHIESLSSIIFNHHLSKLEILQLDGNLLYSLPSSFSYLATLKQLNLSKNRFSTIPQAILYLPNLQLLDLSGNRIREIRDEIESLEVDELNLNNNQISQISTNISKCKRLKICRLDNNELKLKSIPTSLLKNSTVFQLNINGNLFEQKQLQLLEGYDDYERRYTANQHKRDATAILASMK